MLAVCQTNHLQLQLHLQILYHHQPKKLDRRWTTRKGWLVVVKWKEY